MSVCSSIMLIYIYFSNVVLNSYSLAYTVLGIVSIVFLILGNFIYFIAAYYSYGFYQLKFFEKLGSKAILHSNFIF